MRTQYGSYTNWNYYVATEADGNYIALVIDHEGDTRGQPWYSHLTCLASDPTAPLGFTVPAGGF